MQQVADFLDFRTLERPGSPNTFLLAPTSFCPSAEADEAPPVFDETPAVLFGRVEQALQSERGISVVGRDKTALRLKAVAVTSILRFKDDVDIAILNAGDPSAGDRATLAVYSRSRIGYSDLGANARRVRNLIKKLQPR